jgi:hypothetical protein
MWVHIPPPAQKITIFMSEKRIHMHGKISQFPKNTEAEKAYNFLQNVKVSKRKLWYFLIERDNITDKGEKDTQLQMVKYNNKQGVDCEKFINELKNYYKNNEKYSELVDQLIVEGEKDFSIIRNIPDVEIDDKKFISIITQDLIKLLR